MESPRNKIIIFLFLFFSLNIAASDKADIYSAYVSNNMTKWKSVIDRIENTGNKDNNLLLELVNYQYGYIAWCIGNNRNDEARNYLEMAEKNLSVLEKEVKNLSLVNSYKASFYGYRIGLNKLSAPFLGIKSIDAAKLAISLDKNSAFAYVQYANIQFYMPAVFGGSKKEAVMYYLKALDIMEINESDKKENWNYLSLLIVIAQSYLYLHDYTASLFYMEKIMKIEPEFGYVKNELYPQLLNKMKK